MIAIAQIEPPMIKNLEDELFFFPLRERRVGDVWDDLRAMIGLYWCSIDISWFERVRKKRECLYLLLVPLSEASRIAYWSRTATQKPTLEYVSSVFSDSSSRSILLNTLYTYPRASTVASSLTPMWILREFPIVKNQASSKRFILCFCIPPLKTPDRGFCDTVCNCKFNKIFQYDKEICRET